jgi:hypothetical protein
MNRNAAEVGRPTEDEMMDFTRAYQDDPELREGPANHSKPAMGKKKLLGRFSSVEELMDAFLRLEEKLDSIMSKETLRKPPAQDKPQRRPAGQAPRESEDFWEDLSRAYDQDPLLTTHMMILQAGDDLMDEIEGRLEKIFRSQLAAGELDDLLNQPENAGLRKHRRHLEYLTREKGLDPEDALDFLKTLITDQTPGKKAKAAKNVRNQSTMEVAYGKSSGAGMADNDFDKVLKKSRTLNEMFDGLRKIPL